MRSRDALSTELNMTRVALGGHRSQRRSKLRLLWMVPTYARIEAPTGVNYMSLLVGLNATASSVTALLGFLRPPERAHQR